MTLDPARITLLKRLAAGEEHSLAAEDPLWALGFVEGEGDRVQITELGRAYLDALHEGTEAHCGLEDGPGEV
jgi:hypothetical protein